MMKRHQGNVIAEIGTNRLLEEDLQPLVSGLSPEDSTRIVEQYIKQWAINILQYEKAAQSRDEELDRLVEDYRRGLYMHQYEQYLIHRYMPKQITDSALETFYKNHSKQMLLNECIVRGVLIKVPEKAPKMDQLKQWLKEPTNTNNLEKIEKYAYQQAQTYELFIDEWQKGSTLESKMPISQLSLEQRLRKEKVVQAEDSTGIYLLGVAEYHLRGDVQPMEYAREQMEQVLLTERQMEFLQERREALYEHALRYNKLKIYEHK